MSRKVSPSASNPLHSKNNRISSLVSLYEAQATNKAQPPGQNNHENADCSSPNAAYRPFSLPDPPVFKFCSPSLTTREHSKKIPVLLRDASTLNKADVQSLDSTGESGSNSQPSLGNYEERSSQPSGVSCLDSSRALSKKKSGDPNPSMSSRTYGSEASAISRSYREKPASQGPSTTLDTQSCQAPVSMDISSYPVASTSKSEGSGVDSNVRNHLARSISPPSPPFLPISQSFSRAMYQKSQSTTDTELTSSSFLCRPFDWKESSLNPQSSSIPDVGLDTRPLLTRGLSAVSVGTSQTADVPAHRVFSRGAPALLLPALDELLDQIEHPNFGEVTREDMSEQEWETWRDWIRGTTTAPHTTGSINFDFVSRIKPSNLQKTYTADQDMPSLPERVGEERGDLENKGRVLERFEDSPTNPILPKLPSGIPASQAKAPSDQGIRRLIFLPMHLLPPNLTITDLKLNKAASAPLLTLNEILSTAIGAIFDVEASSFALSIMNIEMLRDVIQIIGLLIGFESPSSQSPLYTSSIILRSTPVFSSTPTRIIFKTIPALFGLDFVGAFGNAALWFFVFAAMCSIGLYEFYRLTGGWEGPRGQAAGKAIVAEGFDLEENFHGSTSRWKWRQSKAYITTIVFIIASFYIPLSKISMGALVWTSDFWAVPNPYVNTDQPKVDLLGPSEKYRDPLSFCYTTTMKKKQGVFGNINWSFLLVLVSIFNICALSLWFPVRLWETVNELAPKVDRYTELGEKRKAMDQEYERLVDRDRGPFVYLYNSYRRRWSGFKTYFMAVKLVTVAINTIILKDNCLFRGYPRERINIFRDAISVGLFFSFLTIHLATKPFIHPSKNSSDSVSGLGYLIISVIQLLVSLKVNGSSVLGGPILILVTVLVYVSNVYFSVVQTGISQRMIKRFQKRLDFSIDLFSPHLDLSKHVSRRVWQESVCTMLLAMPEYRISSGKPLKWTEESTGPPYLLRFHGTQAERLIENLKIMKTVGLEEYARAMQKSSSNGQSNKEEEAIQELIINEFTGPDCFWKPCSSPYPENVTTFFGRADVVPFPFTIVFRYDQSPHPILISNAEDIRAYATQNNTTEALRRRQVRQLLRCLEGKEVFSPVTELWGKVKERQPWTKWLAADRSRVHFRGGILKIRRNRKICWRGYNYSSGFEVFIEYHDGQSTHPKRAFSSGIAYQRSASSIGVFDDFRLSPGIIKIFRDNKHIIDSTISIVQKRLKNRREFFASEIAWKRNTMSYSFLLNLLLREEKIDVAAWARRIKEEEVHPKMRAFPETCRGSLRAVEERLRFVRRSKLTAWWYTFFDDVYRKNSVDIPALSSMPADFSPHYRTSICYRPMSRLKLEAFLIKRKLATTDGKAGFFHSGLLNRMYFYLDVIMFEGTSQAIPIHVGTSGEEVKLHNLSFVTKDCKRNTLNHLNPQSSSGPFSNPNCASRFTQGTGEGTDESDPVIRFRNAFTHEQIFDETSQQTTLRIAYTFKKAIRGLQEWFGLIPVHHSSSHSEGVFLRLHPTVSGFELPKLRSHCEILSPDDTSSSVYQASEENDENARRPSDTLLHVRKAPGQRTRAIRR